MSATLVSGRHPATPQMRPFQALLADDEATLFTLSKRRKLEPTSSCSTTEGSDEEEEESQAEACEVEEPEKMDTDEDEEKSVETVCQPHADIFAASSTASSETADSEEKAFQTQACEAEELERAIEKACQLHALIYATFKKVRSAGEAEESDSDADQTEACETAERQTAARYEELTDAVAVLLRGADEEEMPSGTAGGRDYNVVQLRGRKPRLEKKNRSKRGPNLGELLEAARNEGSCGRSRDALCAALATLGSRREKCWLGAASRELPVENPIRGYFTHALVDPTATLRLAILPSVPRPLPASLIVTHLLPLAEALRKIDQCGPFVENPRVMCRAAGRQFTFQEMLPDQLQNAPGDRQHSRLLKPEPRLREILRSKAPAVLLDSFAALAPREVARKHGLADVTKAELLALLREAKCRGQAVVFQVGGDDPRTLAKKVYLQPQYTQFGLRCGNIRWRPSSEEPWVREKPRAYRPLIALQMP